MNCKLPLATMLPLLSIVVLIMPIPQAHTAATTIVYVKPGINYPLVGQFFTVNITIANVSNLAYWQVRLGFDPSIINCTNATVPPDNIFKGYLQEPVVWSINNTEGFIRIENKLGQSGGVSGSGTLFQAKFKALSEGTSGLNFQYIGSPVGTVLLDALGIPISFDALNGFVEVNIAQKNISNVPFYFQEKQYYSGPAALKMIFTFHGESISQQEIAEVARTHPNVTYTDELRRAAHFSNVSTSMGLEMPENITGYTLRKLGYGAFEKSGLTLAQLQASVRSGYPVIVLTWYDLSQQRSHYRVVVCYNATHLKLHDPWNKAVWGGTYGGANTSIDYSTFLTLWGQSNYWGVFVHPWKVAVTFKILDKQPYLLNITANVRYVSTEVFGGSTYPASSSNATIILPPELSLDTGESATKIIGGGNMQPGDSVNVSWLVKSSTTGKFNFTIDARGRISGSVSAHDSYPAYNYQDLIGGKSITTIWLGFAGDLNGDGKVDIKDIAIVAKAFGSYPGSPNWNPIADVTGPTLGVPDNKVDIRDVAYVAKNFGKVYP